MKSIKHVLLAVLALATILTVVSCKNEDDGPSEVASYTGKIEGVELKGIFYDESELSHLFACEFSAGGLLHPCRVRNDFWRGLLCRRTMALMRSL